MKENITILPTDSHDSDFKNLAEELEKELYIRDGDMADILAANNKIDFLGNAVVLYQNNTAIGCGAFREYNFDTIELKRMYIRLAYRGKGLSQLILKELESIAADKNYKTAVLETGKNQPEAIAFYMKHGYSPIEKFGKYVNSENSICFSKSL